MRNELCSGMLLPRLCFHLINRVNGRFDVWLGFARNCTHHIELQDLEPLLVHVEAIQYLLTSSLDIFSCCSNDGQVGDLEQASGKLESNATGGWRYEKPGFGHGCSRMD